MSDIIIECLNPIVLFVISLTYSFFFIEKIQFYYQKIVYQSNEIVSKQTENNQYKCMKNNHLISVILNYESFFYINLV